MEGKFFCLVFSIISVGYSSAQLHEFSVVGPKLIENDNKFDVHVSSDMPIKYLNLTLESQNEGELLTESLSLDENDQINQKLTINSLKSDNINVTLTTSDPHHFTVQDEILCVLSEYNAVFAYILTDKEFYNPGETIKIQVIFLNEKKQSHLNQNEFQILIEDQDGNIEFEESGIINSNPGNPFSETKNLFDFKYEIEDEISLGTLNISITSEFSKQLKLLSSKIIQIKNRNLPNLEIIASFPPARLIGKKFKFNVTAKFLNGFMTEGDLDVNVKIIDRENLITTHSFSQKFPLQSETQQLEIDMNIPESNLIRIAKFDLKFVDKFTKEIVTASHESFICGRSCVDFEIKNEREIKPGFENEFELTPHDLRGKLIPFFDYNITMKAILNTSNCSDIENISTAILKETVNIKEEEKFRFFIHECSESITFIIESDEEDDYGEVKKKIDVSKSHEYLRLTVERIEADKSDTSAESSHDGEKIGISIQSTSRIDRAAYLIIKNGSHIISDHFEYLYGGSDHTFEFKMPKSQDMVSGLDVLGYFILDSGTAIYDTLTITNEKLDKKENDEEEAEAEVSVEVSSSSAVGPGDIVKITIYCEKLSEVLLIALNKYEVDDKDIQLASMFDEIIHQEPRELNGTRREFFILSGIFDAETSNFETSSNKNINEMKKIQSNKLNKKIEKNHDAWIFESFTMTSEGKYEIERKVPDQMTTWRFAAISIPQHGDISYLKKLVEVEVSESFFIQFQLPVFARYNEVIKIDVLIMNKLTQPTKVNVTLFRNDFDNFRYQNRTKNCRFEDLNLQNGVDYMQTVAISPNKISSVTFYIKSLMKVKSESNKIRIRAENAKLNLLHEVEKILNVNRDVSHNGISEKVFINLKNSTTFSKQIKALDLIPTGEDGVTLNHSMKIAFSVSSNLIEPKLFNVEKLMKISENLSEDIRIMKTIQSMMSLMYLSKSNQLNIDKIEFDKFLNDGLDYILTRRMDDGSFTYQGHSKYRSVWLTSYIIEFLGYLEEFITIDEYLITKGLDFLANKQFSNGSFHDFVDYDPKNFQFPIQILLSFLNNPKYAKNYEAVIEKSVEFLNSRISDMERNLDIMMMAYILHLRDDKKKIESFKRSIENTKISGIERELGLTYWEVIRKERSEKPLNVLPEKIEIACYAMMFLLNRGEEEQFSAFSVMMWLSETFRQHNKLFIGGHNSYVVMKALMEYQKTFKTEHNDISIEIRNDGKKIKTLKVDKSNLLSTQTVILNPKIKNPSVHAVGKGFVMAEFLVTYARPINDFEDRIILDAGLEFLDEQETNAKLVVCARQKYDPDENNSNGERSVTFEIEILDGYVYDTESINLLRELQIYKFFVRHEKTFIEIKLEKFRYLKNCLNFKLVKNDKNSGGHVQPAVRAYQYDDDKRIHAVNYYYTSKKFCQ